MDQQCTSNMGRFVPAPGLFAPGQYTAVSNQAHVVMSIACLASTLAFGVHAVAVSGAWVRVRLRKGLLVLHAVSNGAPSTPCAG